MSDLGWNPYAGLPWPVQLGFVIALAVTLYCLLDLVVLCVVAARARRRRPPGHAGAVEADYLWVFVVPALNEEVTILDSVSRLAAIQATHQLIVVVDDGSDDATGAILAGLDVPALRVLRRDPPNARRGKSAVLNAAWAHLHADVLGAGEFARWPPDRVIVGIVDADGRVDADAPARVAPHFADPRTGGVQVLVRIYNRHRPLTWAQDVEFSVFGKVFQQGRSAWGTANMGGSGQFNRLSALDDVATGAGPWRDRLTEDQDIGLRLIRAGWRGRQESSCAISQQGLSALSPLYRQRTRWAQGAWQATTLLPTVRRSRVPFVARLDMLGYLALPLLQTITGVALVTSIVLAVALDVPFYVSGWPVLVFFGSMTAIPGLVALLSRGGGLRGVVLALVQVVPYTAYTWLTFFALGRGLARQATGRGSWAKTAREPLEGPGETEQEA